MNKCAGLLSLGNLLLKAGLAVPYAGEKGRDFLTIP